MIWVKTAIPTDFGHNLIHILNLFSRISSSLSYNISKFFANSPIRASLALICVTADRQNLKMKKYEYGAVQIMHCQQTAQLPGTEGGEIGCCKAAYHKAPGGVLLHKPAFVGSHESYCEQVPLVVFNLSPFFFFLSFQNRLKKRIEVILHNHLTLQCLGMIGGELIDIRMNFGYPKTDVCTPLGIQPRCAPIPDPSSCQPTTTTGFKVSLPFYQSSHTPTISAPSSQEHDNKIYKRKSNRLRLIIRFVL